MSDNTPKHPVGNDSEQHNSPSTFDEAKAVWHKLSDKQIAELKQNNNFCNNWSQIFVTSLFNTDIVRNNTFYGVVHIADLADKTLLQNNIEYHTGITGCTIENCRIGANVAMHNIGLVNNYTIGNNCVITNTREIVATRQATFGCGVEIKAMNEGGNRLFTTFANMLPADAYLQCKFLDNKPLQKALQNITATENNNIPQHGTIADNCLIRNCNTIENSNIQTHSQLSGVTLAKNTTIKSSTTEPTTVGHGVILEDSIIGLSCNVLENSIVQKTLLGSDVTIEKGARVINTMVGDNSTIACCEVQNSMLFHSHQQHHNNSFLIATTLLGQSNIAAGATIGSNHNSRTNTTEITAGRGFWPGLCTSFKHSSKFASFTLVAKADYQYELNIPLPFALVNNNLHTNELEIMPAYWWMYNMYALERNEHKFQHRDKRIVKQQNIETNTLAPDTIEEIINAITLLELWTGTAANAGNKTKLTRKKLIEKGRKILKNHPEQVEQLDIFAEGIENSRRRVRILKTAKAYTAYHQMLLHYAVGTMLNYCNSHPEQTTIPTPQNTRISNWVNLGGQLITHHDFDKLCLDIASGQLATWNDIHLRYHELWQNYTLQKYHHATAVLTIIYNPKSFSENKWNSLLKQFIDVEKHIALQTFLTRSKDLDNTFYSCTYNNGEELKAVLTNTTVDTAITNAMQRYTNFEKYLDQNSEKN